MKKELKTLLVVVVIALVVVGGGLAIFRSTPAAEEKKLDQATLIGTSTHSTATGTYNYKVTIVEFGDYQCPGCAATHLFLKQLFTDYPNKINLIFRHFPLPGHENAMVASQAAEAAGAQGKFWEMHDLLYEHQDDWSKSDQPQDYFMAYAQAIGLNLDQFQKDIASPELLAKIQADQKDGVTFRLNHTPTLFINAEEYTANLNYLSLKHRIDEELAK